MEVVNFNIEDYITECSYEKDDSICISDYIIDKVVENNIIDKNDDIEKLKDKTNCEEQICVIDYLKKEKIIDNIEYNNELLNFKPKGPTNKEWVNDKNISEVLLRYSRKFEDFYYFSYQMLDFAEYETKFYNANWVKLINSGFNTFGVIINTDKWSSNGAGIHWFTIFIDARNINKITIEYFNSSGNYPYNEILEWFGKIKITLEKEFKNNVELIRVVRKSLQIDNHSCGIYSLFYQYYRLKGVNYSEFDSDNVYDKKMDKFRKFLFR
jgi:hypothetical protein